MAATIQIDGVSLSHKTVAFGATVSLTNASLLADSQRWELLDYATDLNDTAPDFATNFSSWTLQGDGTYRIAQASGPFAAVTFKPDVTGSYILRLTSFEGLNEYTDTCVVSVVEAHTGEELEAAGETTERSDRAGYKIIANKRMKRLGKRMQGYIRVINVSGGSIARGKVVRLTSTQDAHTVTPNADPGGSTVVAEKLFTITVADNTAVGAGLFDYAVLDETVANNGFGWAQKFGLFEGKSDVNYTGFTAGSWVYFNSTGDQVGTPPSGLTIPIGTLLQAGSTGTLSIGLAGVKLANTDGSLTVTADQVKVGVLATDAQHGVRGGASQHAVATSGAHGFHSSTDKAAFDALNILTTKGDLLTRTTVYARLGIGTDGQVLMADVDSPAGMKWSTPVVSPTGTGAVNRITYWSAAAVLTGDAGFTWDQTTFAVTGNQTLSGTFSAGAAKFTVGAAGDLTKINNVAYTWPASQGAASTVLTNNGSGTLTWTAASALTGSGGANRVTLWSSTSALTSDAGFTYSSNTLGITNAGASANESIEWTGEGGLSLAMTHYGSTGSVPFLGSFLRGNNVIQHPQGKLYIIPNTAAFGNGTTIDSNGRMRIGQANTGSDPHTDYALTVGGSQNGLFINGSANNAVLAMDEGSSAALSASGTARIIYTAGTLQVSLNGAAYTALSTSSLTGAGAANRIALWSGTSSLTSSAALTFDTSSYLTLTRTALGTTVVGSVTSENSTAAAAGAQQYSPTSRWLGRGWATGSGGSSKIVEFAVQTRPVQGTTLPTGEFHVLSSIDGSGYLSVWKVDGVGTVTSTLNALGTSSVAGLVLRNTTSAGAGAQQQAPTISFIGQGWKTDATAASQQVEFRQRILPVEGTANPSVNWTLQSCINDDGVYTTQFTVTSAGLTQVDKFKHTGSTFSVFGATGVGQQTRGATLTNNVTSGGTDDVIDDITDVATYSNAGAGVAIRNALYQLARAQRQHDVALRNLGYLT